MTTARGAWVAAVLLVLTACSSPDGEPQAEPTAGPSGGSTPTEATETTPEASQDETSTEPTEPPPYLPVPDGVELTAQGSELRVGERASVAWEPRREVVGALDIRVTRLARTSLKDFAAFRLDATQRRSTPYYVRATIDNVGRTNLAGVSVPLYVVNGQNTLIQSTPFAAAFKPCPSAPFPGPFATGDRVQVCLVYLVPQRGALKSVSFRPTQEYDPITWIGRVEKR